jgi:hypothetical protein
MKDRRMQLALSQRSIMKKKILMEIQAPPSTKTWKLLSSKTQFYQALRLTLTLMEARMQRQI